MSAPADAFRELLRVSTPAMADPPNPERLQSLAVIAGPLGQEWATLLLARNGFTSFESALIVRPLEDTSDLAGAIEWSDFRFWQSHYGDLAPKGICFAEDVFGNPFVLGSDGIYAYDLETGDSELFAGSISQWASRIRDERSMATGWPLAHEWQESKSTIPIGHRLAPKRPFVLGGDYVIDNLVLVRDKEGVRARGDLACKLQNLPSGSPVSYELKIDG